VVVCFRCVITLQGERVGESFGQNKNHARNLAATDTLFRLYETQEVVKVPAICHIVYLLCTCYICHIVYLLCTSHCVPAMYVTLCTCYVRHIVYLLCTSHCVPALYVTLCTCYVGQIVYLLYTSHCVPAM